MVNPSQSKVDFAETIRYGGVEDVRKLLDGLRWDLNEPVPDSISASAKTYLMVAAEQTDLPVAEKVMKMLLERGADPLKPNAFGKQVIHYLAERDAAPSTLLMMLSYGVDMDAVAGSDSGTPLLYASARNQERVADFLLEAGANSHAQDGDGVSAVDGFLGHGNEAMAAKIQRNAVPPKIDIDDDLTREKLLQKNAEGVCPLDAGMLWVKAPRFLEQLEGNGFYLTREDMLAQGKNGKQFAVRAFEFNGGPALCQHLTENGLSFRAEDLVTPYGEPKALLQAAIDHHQVDALFSVDAWLPHGLDEMQRVYRALPEESRQEVKNYQVLRQRLSSLQQPLAAGRGR